MNDLKLIQINIRVLTYVLIRGFSRINVLVCSYGKCLLHNRKH